MNNDLKMLTFEYNASKGLTNGGNYNMTSRLSNVTLVLVNFRIDTVDANFASTLPSISLEIGNVVNSNNVIDNDVNNFFLKVPLIRNSSGGVNSTSCQPMLGFKSSGDVPQLCSFFIRYADGSLVPANAINYFIFQFQVIQN